MSDIARIYMCLDTLHDTRLSVLAQLNEDYAVEALMNAYPIRWTDDPQLYCPSCGSDHFFDAYRQRDKQALKHAYPTEHAIEFADTIHDLEIRMIAGEPGTPKKLEILINFWPYRLTQAEITQYVKSFRTLFKCTTPIRMISKPLHEVTTDWMQINEVIGAYIYNHSYWVDECITRRQMNGESIAYIPEVVVYFPAIMLNKQAASTLEEFRKEYGGIPDVFAAHVLQLSRVIAIDWLNSAQYSITTRLLFPKDVVPAPEPVKEQESEEIQMDNAYLIDRS